mmetsp:Transcript_10248/g.23060  ORF Transcript_10248/g.23060 Transcript_10248/m.23060 type:complete len:205 (+) Transcript_10248:224-838(+)
MELRAGAIPSPGLRSNRLRRLPWVSEFGTSSHRRCRSAPQAVLPSRLPLRHALRPGRLLLLILRLARAARRPALRRGPLFRTTGARRGTNPLRRALSATALCYAARHGAEGTREAKRSSSTVSVVWRVPCLRRSSVMSRLTPVGGSSAAQGVAGALAAMLPRPPTIGMTTLVVHVAVRHGRCIDVLGWWSLLRHRVLPRQNVRV